MASSTRNHTIKRDIAKGTILSRIATSALIPERYDALYYEILGGLDLQNLPAHKQVAATLFAAVTCNIVNKIDCRDVVTDADFQEKLVQFQGIDDLYNQWFKLFDKLNSGQSTKEQPKEQENKQESIGIELQKILSANIDNDNRNATN